MNRHLLFSAAMAAVLFFAGIARAELSDGLVSYWPLDDNFADRVGQNDGELMGSDDEAVFESGQFGQGILLDGIDQFVEIGGDESEFDFIDQDFSISTWFRADALTKSWQALIAKGEGNRWRVHRRGGEGIMTWNGGNADVPAYDPDEFGLEPIDDGEMHHFVGISDFDEGVIQMYIDGELVAENFDPVVENNDMPVMIGENPDARNRTWEGLIDDVAIWGRALDEGEVATLWNDGAGTPVLPPDGPELPFYVGGQDIIGTRNYTGEQSNEMFGPEQAVPGFSGRIVTFEDSGLTLDNHTIAEEALEDNDGTTAITAYPVVDMAGGGGTFPENQPYPDGSTAGDDFAVQVTAEVTIPAGTWTIGFGSDDGGQITIPGVEFLIASDPNDSFDDDQIRFEGNRGHGWTVGSFELSEPLETTITASFHERGGGDSFEIAVIEDEVIEAADPANGWELLGDETLGWSVGTTAAPLISADLTATVKSGRPMEFDVNGDTNESDQLVLENPDPDVFTTIMDITNGDDGLTFQIKSAGTVTSGEAFTIVSADQIVGTPTITSVNAGQNWVWDGENGRVCLDTCPGVGVAGDYNGNGLLDAGDLDLHASVGIANQDLAYDANNDGVVDVADRVVWTNDLKNTWMGDSDLNGVFDTADFVLVFGEGKYETGDAATWGQGDWDGNQLFDSGDFVAAFGNGGYEMGERAGGPNPVTAVVPEPSSMVLALISLLGLAGVARRRNG